jgi:sterol desaturase/sphingolipid hydroxylase (fatty acid hydroxylase superfamily)
LELVTAFGIAFIAQLVTVLAVMAAERVWPAKPQQSGKSRNIGIGMIVLGTELLAGSWLAPLTTFAINAAGGGIIVLPAHGWWLAASVVIYFVAMDFGEYFFHRAQHALPFMWAMHSLHHSDPSFGTTTTVRHFWLESWIKMMTIWLAVGILFKAPPAALAIYSAIGFYNFLTHANLRINFGPLSWLLNSSAYHRLHHSAREEHFDKNFAALLPVFDVLSGVYVRPAKDEWPDTGLNNGAKPDTVWEAVIWPLRDRIARPACAAPDR